MTQNTQAFVKAYEAWRLKTTQQRVDIIKEAGAKLAELTGDADKAIPVFAHLLSHAPELDDSVMLTGATGESNELYIQSRGKTLVVATDSAQPLPMMAQLIAALVAGNPVQISYPNQPEIAEQAVQALRGAGVPAEMLTVLEDFAALNMADLSQVAVTGSIAEVQQLAGQLSQTDGILTQVIAVTDMVGCHEVFAPEYLHRLVTERVKTINTTAIGGNASLLELGAG